METDALDLGQRVGRAGVAAVAYLSRQERTAVALRRARLRRLEDESRAIVADVLDLVTASLRDRLPSGESARLVTTLEAALALVRDGDNETDHSRHDGQGARP